MIPNPTQIVVNNTLERWKNLENYVLQENSLTKLFINTYPHNTDINDVLIKVCALNDFYSTNIYSPFTVAKHIIELKIDDKLQNGDLDIVNMLSTVKMSNEKIRNFYSFASKYCSLHRPELYPIYDSFAEKILIYFQKKDKFAKFKRDDLKNYQTYKSIIISFSKFYALSNFSLKDIDRYLWITGKDYFPKKQNAKTLAPIEAVSS